MPPDTPGNLFEHNYIRDVVKREVIFTNQFSEGLNDILLGNAENLKNFLQSCKIFLRKPHNLPEESCNLKFSAYN